MTENVTQKGRVYLVGAGPGDPGLVTVRGRRCIETADVLVYDRLVNYRLLSYARADAEVIFAGKLPGRHSLTQEEINELLAEKARQGFTVTRLKGGDPFLFGRGGEEAELLAEKGIPFEVVPGITSAVSVPAYAGIPVTHRELSSTVTMVTGHEDPLKNDSQISWSGLGVSTGTLVFLMGMANLSFIVRKLVEHGREPSTPVALIRWGTLAGQRTVTGCLGDIVAKARSAGLGAPAIIVVGKVVSLRDRLQWFEKKPLFGRRIVITRPPRQAAGFAEKIEELGGEALEFPVIEICPPADYGPLDRAVENARNYDWIIFTSANGVRYFFERMAEKKKDIRNLKGVRLCAIGPRTAGELNSRGLLADFMPPEYRAEGILEQIGAEVKPGERVLLPRAAEAREILPETLSSMGAEVDVVEAYRTLAGKAEARFLVDMLKGEAVHAVTFTSSSTVRSFAALLGDNFRELLEGVTVASIGPVTSATCRELGLPVHVEASEYTVDGLLEALLKHFAHGSG